MSHSPTLNKKKYKSHRFAVHLKLYCTHLTVHSLYCPVQYISGFHVRYPGYDCPNAPALTVHIRVKWKISDFSFFVILTLVLLQKSSFTDK